MMFVQRALEHNARARVWTALDDGGGGVSPEAAHAAGAHFLFGAARDLPRWNARFSEGRAGVEHWAVFDDPAGNGSRASEPFDGDELVPLAVIRRGRPVPYDDEARLKKGDLLIAAINLDSRAAAHDRLRTARCRPITGDSDSADNHTPAPADEPGTVTQ